MLILSTFTDEMLAGPDPKPAAGGFEISAMGRSRRYSLWPNHSRWLTCAHSE